MYKLMVVVVQANTEVTKDSTESSNDPMIYINIYSTMLIIIILRIIYLGA